MCIHYTHHRWQSYRWRKAERVYFASLQQNIFGQWLLIKRWGVTDSRRGGSTEHIVDTYDEGLKQLDKARKRRKSRGYTLQ